MIEDVKNVLINAAGQRPKIAVIGDLMLDEYVLGDVERISPEDPVPVVNFRKKISAPGGAANVAANLASLGAKTFMFGAVGYDKAGEKIIQKLKKQNINTHGVFRASKPTIRKIRILGRDKHLLRVDYESKEEIEEKIRNKIFQRFNDEFLDKIDAVVISDYKKGLFSKRLAQNIINSCRKKNKIIVADFRPAHKDFYKGVSIITPNLKEAIQMSRKTHEREIEPREICEVGKNLVKFFNSSVLITQGANGLTLFQKTQGKGRQIKPFSLPAFEPKIIYDVAGAGDTVAAALAWSLANNTDIKKSTFLANIAGSVAVSKRGTSVVSLEEILNALNPNESKIKTENELKAILERLKRSGKKIVFTNGCFDLLNTKHMEFLRQASRFGDALVVAVNSDKSVMRLKGHPRPIIKLNDRLKMLSALNEINYLISFEESSPIKLLTSLKPDIYVKGADYKIKEIPEAKIVKKYGGKIKLVPKIKGPSTTSLIKNIIQSHNS